MAPRKPKNPIKDISDAVGGWLGGRGPGTNPVIQRYERDLGTVAQTIDTFTGGLGAAAGRDVRNFAQGGSLPTNLAKTAAVNLAAGAVGAKAAQVAGKVIAAGQSRFREVGVHLSDVPNLSRISYSTKRAGAGLGRPGEVGQTYKFSPYTGTKTEKFTASEFANVVAKENVNLASKSGMSPKNYGYITRSPSGQIDPAYGSWSNARMVPSQRVADRAVLPKSGDVDEVRKQIYSALVRAERNSQRNARAVANTFGGAVGIGFQQAASRKARGGGAKKR